MGENVMVGDRSGGWQWHEWVKDWMRRGVWVCATGEVETMCRGFSVQEAKCGDQGNSDLNRSREVLPFECIRSPITGERSHSC